MLEETEHGSSAQEGHANLRVKGSISGCRDNQRRCGEDSHTTEKIIQGGVKIVT